MRSSKFKAALIIMLFSSIFPELLTLNTPLPRFFKWPVFLFLFFVGYGLPVLCIREILTRCKTGLATMLFAGLIYGLHNEGLIAKTLLRYDHLPISAFDHYGYIFGINVPWMLTMTLWHAIASVMAPILAGHTLVPSVARVPWLKTKEILILMSIILFFDFLVFFGQDGGRGTVSQMMVLLVVGAVYFFAGYLFREKIIIDNKTKTISWAPFWAGISTFIYIISLFFLAQLKTPLVVFGIGFVTIAATYATVFIKKKWLALPHLFLFSAGFYVQTAVFSLWTGINSGTEIIPALFSAGLSSLLFIFLAVQIIKKTRTS